jgi:hypothetical protein
MRHVEKVPVPERFDFQSLIRIYAENEMAGCIHFRATEGSLSDLVGLAGDVREHSVCDHLIGFKDETSIFSFHDAFTGAKMYVFNKCSRGSGGSILHGHKDKADCRS